jgi:CRP-like cAMP-binding protein
MPDEYVFLDNEAYHSEKSLFFVMDGIILIKMQNETKILAIVEKAGHFGEITFFTNMQHSASAKSVSFTSL